MNLRSPVGIVLLATWILLLAAPIGSAAQPAELRGTVEDAVSGKPLPGASVEISGPGAFRRGTSTSEAGRFHFAGVPAGRYELRVRFVGYESLRDTLHLESGASLIHPVQLQRAIVQVEGIEVRSRPMPIERQAGMTRIRSRELRALPTADLTGDLAGYLLTLPSVSRTGDRGGQLFVRGGTPTQNLVLLDGMPIYQPFHIVGSYSAFPAALVHQTDLYGGGFQARYGGRLSSVIDVRTLNGSKQRVRASGTATPLLADVHAELPLVTNRVSLVGYVREAFMDRSAPALLGRELPFSFGDRFAKVHAYLNERSSLSLTGLHTTDSGVLDRTATRTARLNWTNTALGGHFRYLPAPDAVLFRARIHYTRYHTTYHPLRGVRRENEISEFGGKMEWTYLRPAYELEFGLFANTNSFLTDVGLNLPEDIYTTGGGAFATATVRLLDEFQIQPGVRLQGLSSSGRLHVEPRLRASWTPGGGRHTLSVAAGTYHQQIIGLYNVRDISDAFLAWTPLPDGRPSPSATHLLAGWETALGRGRTLSVEGYYKRMRNLSVAHYYDLLDDELRLDAADGEALGADIRVEWPLRFGAVQASYSLSDLTYRGGLARGAYTPPFHQRHRLYLGGYADLAALRFGLSWQYGSGRPFTRFHGLFYEADPAAADRPSESGSLNVLFDEPFGGTTPPYHRLDLSLTYRFPTEGIDGRAQLRLINLYDRANLFDYDVLSGRRIDQLPFLPSFSLRLAVP